MRTARPWTLGAKLSLVAAPILPPKILSIAVRVWMSVQLERGAAAVNEAGRLRMPAQRMALSAGTTRTQALAPEIAEFEHSLPLLGTQAGGFNKMAEELPSMYRGLESRVQWMLDAMARGDPARQQPVLGEIDVGVRELPLHFRSRTDGEDIEPALQATLRNFEHQTGLEATLKFVGEGLPLAPDQQIQVLHIVQEAWSNVRKQAPAGQVWLDGQGRPQWRLELRDDGHGFTDDQSRQDETHVGLRGSARGHGNKEIARALGIAETTVKIHVRHILRQLDISSRVQAAVPSSGNGVG